MLYFSFFPGPLIGKFFEILSDFARISPKVDFRIPLPSGALNNNPNSSSFSFFLTCNCFCLSKQISYFFLKEKAYFILFMIDAYYLVGIVFN